MLITPEILNAAEKYAAYGHTIAEILLLCDIPPCDHYEYIQEFDDPNSTLAISYRKGELKAHQERIDNLDNMLESGADGAGDAARAIGYMKKQTGHNDLKRELFGL